MAERGDVDQYLLEGERLMESKFYDRAMVEFNKALKLDSKITMRVLDNLFDAAEDTGDYEGVVSIGTNMLLNQKKNGTLANKLGNAYRKMNNFAQAIKLYEHCIKFSPDERFATYNLAATMARIDIYDGNAVSAVLPFEQMRSAKLPENEEGEERLKALQRQILKEQEKELTSSEEEEDWQEKLKKEAETIKPEKKSRNKQEKINMVPEEIFEHLRHQGSTKEQQRLLLDLSIYCLEKNFPGIAWRALTRLVYTIPEDEYIQSFVAMSYALRGEEKLAIDKLLSLLGKNQYNRFANANLGYLYKKQGNDLLAKKYFIITYQLLEKSQELYDMKQFRQKGEKYFKDEIYKNAVKVFEVLREEEESPEVLAIACPHSQFTLIDSTEKKIKALQWMIARLALPNTQVVKGRAEELGRQPLYKHRFSILTARAVASLKSLEKWTRDLRAPDAVLHVYKGGDLRHEMKELSTIKSIKKVEPTLLALDQAPQFAQNQKQIVSLYF